jgi:hypothetical protein
MKRIGPRIKIPPCDVRRNLRAARDVPPVTDQGRRAAIICAPWASWLLADWAGRRGRADRRANRVAWEPPVAARATGTAARARAQVAEALARVLAQGPAQVGVSATVWDPMVTEAPARVQE